MTTNRSGSQSLVHHGLPILVIAAAVLIIWYLGAYFLNAPMVLDQLARKGIETPDFPRVLAEAYAMKRPILPTPDQIAVDLWTSTTKWPLDSVRNLLFHAAVTSASTLTGFAMGLVLGISLAVGIIHSRTLDGGLMPWVIASQTIPILAIAPMIVVVLGNIGFTGLLPKAVISMYLCFFPITIGMVKGLRSTDPLALDLMRTYSASPSQVFWKLRLPGAMPFLFTSMKIAIAISLVGAIVGELPTGSQSGLGSRLLSGSYYGQTVQIWSALILASVLSVVLVALVARIEKAVIHSAGGHR
jgi:NitT/TauT family transport system permease protein